MDQNELHSRLNCKFKKKCFLLLQERMNCLHPKLMAKHEELEEFSEILKVRLEVEENYAKGMDEIAKKINKYQEKLKEYALNFNGDINFTFITISH